MIPAAAHAPAAPLWASCPFCNIINGHADATVVEEWDDAIAIEPLNPVTDGHVLVIPREHVSDYTTSPEVTAATMRRAAEFGTKPSNIITSAGREATQSVRHLHLHIVPRSDGDNLSLPWADQARAERAEAEARRLRQQLAETGDE